MRAMLDQAGRWRQPGSYRPLRADLISTGINMDVDRVAFIQQQPDFDEERTRYQVLAMRPQNQIQASVCIGKALNCPGRTYMPPSPSGEHMAADRKVLPGIQREKRTD